MSLNVDKELASEVEIVFVSATYVSSRVGSPESSEPGGFMDLDELDDGIM